MAKQIIAKSSGMDFETPPEGQYIARCFKMIDVGTQEVTNKYGTQKKRQVYIFFELLKDEDDEDVRQSSGDPFVVMKVYTLSLNSKSQLRKDLAAWRGADFTAEEMEKFNIANLVDKFCMLQIVNNESNGNTYTNINSIMKFSQKKAEKLGLEGVNDELVFTVDDFTQEELDELSQSMQQKVLTSAEYWAKSEVDGEDEVKPTKKKTTTQAKMDEALEEDDEDEEMPF